MSICPDCAGEMDDEMDDEMREAQDRWALMRMTKSLKENPDLARELWLVLKLAGSEVK